MLKNLIKLLIPLCIPISVATQCSLKEVFDGTRCLQFINTVMNFHDAYSFCTSQNYNLVSIHDQFYNNYLMNTAGVVFNSSYSSYFIGLNKVLTDTWQWSDNSTFDFNNWDRGEPSSVNSCSVQRISDGKWLTYSCAMRLPFICYNLPNISHPTTTAQIQTTAMTYNLTTTRYHKKCGVGLESSLSKSKNLLAPNGSCSDGYTYFDRTNSCYKVQVVNYTGFWDPAICPPAAIHSVEEDCFVKDLAVNFLSSRSCLPNFDDWDFFLLLDRDDVANKNGRHMSVGE